MIRNDAATEIDRRALLVLAAATLAGCGQAAPAQRLPVRVGIALQPGALLFLLARELGSFEQAGLAPSYQLYPSGKRALREGLLTGHVDVVSAADLPVVQAINERQALAVLAKIQSVRSINSIVARVDRGIEGVQDLVGKRVGTQRDSALHFFLDRALKIQGVNPQAVTHVYQPIESLVDSLRSGAVDALSIREPYVSQLRTSMQDQVRVLQVPWAYLQYELVVSSRTYADQHEPVLERVLRALLMAEDYLQHEPAAARSQVAKALGVRDEVVADLLQQTSNRVRLGGDLQPLLIEQTTWLAPASGLDPSGPLQEALYPKPLRAVLAKRVAIGV